MGCKLQEILTGVKPMNKDILHIQQKKAHKVLREFHEAEEQLRAIAIDLLYNHHILTVLHDIDFIGDKHVLERARLLTREE